MVRIHPDPPVRCRVEAAVYRYLEQDRGCSSIGRAPALQAGGRRFDPVQLHQVSIGCRQDSLHHSRFRVSAEEARQQEASGE